MERLCEPPNCIRLVATDTWGWEFAVRDPFEVIFRGLATIKVYFGHGPVFAINDWFSGTGQLREDMELINELNPRFPEAAISDWIGNGWVRNAIFYSDKQPTEISQSGTHTNPAPHSLGMPTQWIESMEYYAGILQQESQKRDEQSERAPTKPFVVGFDKRFLVALSFPGEYRSFVEKVAHTLKSDLGQERVLYDRYFEAEFARPNLDTHLQRLYHGESELVVVFLCAEYDEKEWTGLEWRAIRDRIKKKDDMSIMLICFDNADVSGVLSIDGYVSARGRMPAEIASLIMQRLQILEKERSGH